VYIAHVTRWVGRVLADEQVDIMHAFLPHSYAYGMFACALWRRRAKTVMSRLSLNFYKDSHKVIAWLERNVLHQRVDIAIGNSKLILDELAEEGVARSKLRLLYNGVDPEPFVRAEGDRDLAREAFGIAEDAYVMVAVGNLHEYKGHADLIDACALVRDRMPDDWRLIIGGRDQRGNRAVLERQIAELGLASNVRLLGACENVAQLLKAGDVFVQPSHHEGLPNAIIEAMAASLPVVGTTVGGIPEAVIPENGQAPTTVPGSDASAADDSELGADATTGWLVPPHDPDALGRALLEAAADPLLRAEMGVRAVARVQAQFSLDHSVAAYMAIYRELLP
jgi:glycosyltransferase involved in cell wall biosynthesis